MRLSLSDLSNPGSLSASDISNSLIGSNLHIFTLSELKVITHDFSSSNFLGEGGFGPVHKGFIDDKIRPGLEAQPVAVKLLDLDGNQGHREWLDYTAKLSDFGLAKDGPQGDDTHVTTRIMGTQGYAAPEYIMTGHLTAKSDVYSFGVVLLELLSGRRAMEKSRPSREQNLVEWAKPFLKDPLKLDRIMDPKLQGQYSLEGAKKAALLAHQCLSHHAKFRPTMSHVVKTLEPLMDLDDIPVGPFVYIVPTEGEKIKDVQEKGNDEEDEEEEKKEKGNEGDKEEVEKKENSRHRQRKGHRHRHRIRSLRSRAVYSDTALYKTLRKGLDSPKQHGARGRRLTEL
ncbi:hypothetical protein F0562_024197 [Nyssa sinensis]|uniref:Protein kinase domain-containing protein n=1 Tax=Nyssa sinensis TaxID=561372 RepID=A0A5J5BCY9_9ASTE|nr:hypothetical protein F0562_024197 [Nyssa sinensis]